MTDATHDQVIGGRPAHSVLLHHITLEQLQGLPDGVEFFASFQPSAPAHAYVMGPELKDYVIHRAHHVNGCWQGDLGCSGVHDFERVHRADQDVVCPSCHHRNQNHPTCALFSWLTVLCGGRHVKL